VRTETLIEFDEDRVKHVVASLEECDQGGSDRVQERSHAVGMLLGGARQRPQRQLVVPLLVTAIRE
jgi:hypothetical protein